jgi:hypothetical protein
LPDPTKANDQPEATHVSSKLHYLINYGILKELISGEKSRRAVRFP